MIVYVVNGYHTELEWREIDIIFRTREDAECYLEAAKAVPDTRIIYDIDEFEVR